MKKDSLKQLNQKSISSRIVYLDYLRVLATFGVIVIHVASDKYNVTQASDFSSIVCNLFESLSSWAVPIFVMISGFLFLTKEISLKQIYSKYIVRLIFAYLAWHFVYGFFLHVGFLKTWKENWHTYHMWYIPMMIGIYICIPICKALINDRGLCKYYFAITLVLSSITLGSQCLGDFVSESLGNAIRMGYNKLDISYLCRYPFYFMLGYYLGTSEIDKGKRTLIYSLGIIGGSIVLVLDFSKLMQEGICGNYYDSFSPTMIFMASAIFVWFRFNIAGKHRVIMAVLSKYSFGVYLVHVLVINKLDKLFGISAELSNVVLSVPFVSVLVFTISFCISAILNHIPLVNKYIV